MSDWFPKRTLGALPADAARRWGSREAVLFKGQRWRALRQLPQAG